MPDTIEAGEPDMNATSVATIDSAQDDTAPALPAAITPMQMLQIAVDQGADIDKLTKLMDLQERWEKNAARKAYDIALGDFKKTPPTVIKDKTGHNNTTYASLAASVGAIAPELSKYGLSHRWETSQSENLISVTCILSHTDGHSESTTLTAAPDTSGSKNSVQAIGSTVTYLERYTLLSITGLATSDQDDDANFREVDLISDQQKQEIIKLIQDSGADAAKFYAHLGVESVDKLPANKFDRAKAALIKKLNEGKNNA